MLSFFKRLFGRGSDENTEGAAYARGVEIDQSEAIERRYLGVDRRTSTAPYFGVERRVANAGRGRRQDDVETVETMTEVVGEDLATGTDSRVFSTRPTGLAPVETRAPRVHLVTEMPTPDEESVDTPLHNKVAPVQVQTESDVKRIMKEPFEGMLVGVVSQAASSDCLILYLGCAQVAIVLVEPFARNLHFAAILKTLTNDWYFHIRHMFYGPPALVAALREQCLVKMDRNPDFAVSQEGRLKRVYEDIIEAAVRMGASDVHLRTRDEAGEVLVRLHGTIRPWLTLSRQLIVDSLSAGFGHFVGAGTNNSEQFKGNEAQAFMTRHAVVVVDEKGESRVKQIDARYNHRPHLTGLASVIRILESSQDLDEIPTLAKLGYSKSQEDMLNLGMSRKWGIVLFVASTGQGKSTTLRTLYTYLPNAATQIIYTNEQPAEYRYKYAIQFSTPVKTDDTPEQRTLKQNAVTMDFLRMDPDRGMVGEIRDATTAKTAIEFTQTGHPSASTMHGDSAIDGLSRLTGDAIQVPAQVLGNAKLINVVVYQQLLPKLCPKCRLPAVGALHGLTAHKCQVLKEKFKLNPAKMYVANPSGCEFCRPKVIGLRGNGTKDVTVAAEIFMPDTHAKRLMARQDWNGLGLYWRKQRRSRFDQEDTLGKNAFEHALYLMSIGLVSPLDVEANFEPFELAEVIPVEADQEVMA